ncbi:MAG: imidazole glycerol phosphate synthase subunit HisH [Rhodospirillales bacterium]|nr:imidazole glycerol phosphate synthase subunit HisH [Rhodospirillales bacterium]
MTQSVAVVDYGSGNLRSCAKALERVALERGGATIVVTADPEEVRKADRVVLPGVGAFADCMRGLLAVDGMREALEDAVRKQAKPFLGICVGMQLMAERGVEFGTHQGLGWLRGEVRAIEPRDGLKVPHMGWNDLDVRAGDPLFKGLPTGTPMYFVHSYALMPGEAADVSATAEYGGKVTAAVRHANMAGTQFHPEKSQAAGLRLIANFLDWTP